jgi:CubicO group peptidase (beta-lactamase class C family)
MKNSTAKLKRIIKWVILTPIISVFISLVVLFILYSPPKYVLRALIWQDSGVNDYLKFPKRQLKACTDPFYFYKVPQEKKISQLFEKNQRINNLGSFLTESGTQAFIVIRNDTILYEKYFNRSSRNSIVTSFSIAKSFTSALIGCAITDGYINSIEDPITDYLPELSKQDKRFNKITIRDLLMMTSGLRFKKTHFLNGDEVKAYYQPDLRKTAIEEAEIIRPPGKYFLYNHYHPLLLGLILERTTGMHVTDYLQKRIWEPLGMEFDGSWSLDSDASGFEKMENGINARAIDFAKFGRLFLKKGNWDGTRVLSQSWVNESVQPDSTAMKNIHYPKWFSKMGKKRYYKYMWWGWLRDKDEYDFYAEGDKGQFLYVSPAKKLIFVRHGEKYGISYWPEIFYEAASNFSSQN